MNPSNQNPSPEPELNQRFGQEPYLPVSFRVVATAALVWNLLGIAAFITQLAMTPEDIASLPAAQQPLYENIPWWAVAAFAVAVFGGTLGCLGLLLRKAWALAAFVASLAGALVQNAYFWLAASGTGAFGITDAIMPGLVIVVAVGLIGFAWHCRKKGYLN